MDDDAPQVLIDAMGGEKADVVLSDIAHNTVGHRNTDHIKVMLLVEAGYEFALEVLKPHGAFVAKVFQGGTVRGLSTIQFLKKILKPSNTSSRPQAAKNRLRRMWSRKVSAASPKARAAHTLCCGG